MGRCRVSRWTRTSATLRQPPGGDLVEVGQVAEGPAVEQVLLDEVEPRLDLPFRLGAARQAGPRFVAVVGGEGQKTRIVEWPVLIVPQHHDLHVVVQTDGGHALQVVEGADVFPDRGREVLGLDKVQVRPPRVAQDVAEQIDAAPAFRAEVDVISAVVHLCLGTGGGLEADDRFPCRLRPQLLDPLADDGVAAGKAPGTQFFMDPHGRHVRVAFQELADEGIVLIQATRPRRRLRQWRRRRLARPLPRETAKSPAAQSSGQRPTRGQSAAARSWPASVG